MTFWTQKTLAQLSNTEWESLCDGCGRCCTVRLRRANLRLLTRLGCPLLSPETGQCSDYANRHERMAHCKALNPENVGDWLPRTCAYRLVKEGKPLPEWHHLVCGDRERVHEGYSVRGWVVPMEPGMDPMKHLVGHEEG
ncbi:CxxCxxCC domain-containing protein [Sabulicella rubraurantiaca]|uniref:YcgN family cysteine cluster protein n=1 Tax=Sabulicella rubraurantiaca TaxID=2811429 RepID=UPI001A963C4B|nr:YcgN family cysteine cluster protein [Sabulicella rubraurantiaca]